MFLLGNIVLEIYSSISARKKSQEYVQVFHSVDHKSCSYIVHRSQYMNCFLPAGLYSSASESGPLAASVKDSAGVYFIPAFQGLQVCRSLKLYITLLYY